jgi:putative sterol carrier protein
VTTLHYVVGDQRHDVEAPGEGELTLLATPEVWEQLTSGALDPVVAYMRGALKVSGDMAALYDLLPTIPLPS